MTNAELIKALRRCSYMTVAGADREDGYCKPCAYFAEDTSDITCIDLMMIDAADALEADEKRIAELERQHGEQLTRNVMLTARLPKEGEWIPINWTYDSILKCSNCGELACCCGDYCPNCGAKMDGERKDGERRSDD